MTREVGAVGRVGRAGRIEGVAEVGSGWKLEGLRGVIVRHLKHRKSFAWDAMGEALLTLKPLSQTTFSV